MEEGKKNFYTIAETIKIKGITEEELFSDIREGKIKIHKSGMRSLIPAFFVFNDITGQDNATQQKNTEKIERYLEQLRPDLLKMLDDAPKYGSCGIIVTFHEGIISKVSTQKEDTILVRKS